MLSTISTILPTILTASFLVLAVLSLLPGLIKARKRHWTEAVVRVVITLISAVAAVFLTPVLTLVIGKALIPFISSILEGNTGDIDIIGIFNDVPSAQNLVEVMIALVITIIVFIVLFLVIRLILDLSFVKLLTKLFLKLIGQKEIIPEIYPSKEHKKEAKANRKFSPIAALVGMLCGLFTFFMCSVPVAGLLSTASIAGKTVSGEGEIYQIAEAASNNVGTVTVMTVASPVYDTMTSYTVNENKVVINNEVKFVAKITEGVVEMSSEDEDAPAHVAASLREASNLAKDTTLSPSLLSEFITAASECWLNGEDFHGIEIPSLGDNKMANTIITSLLKNMKGATTEEMIKNIETMANIFAIIMENPAADGDDLLSNGDLITQVSVELLNNAQLSGTVSDIVDETISDISASLDLPSEDDEEFHNITDNLANNYNEIISTDSSGQITESTLNDLSSAIGSALTEQGITLSESEQKLLATTLVSKLGTEQISKDQVAALLAQYR